MTTAPEPVDRMESRNPEAYWMHDLANSRIVTENEAESWYEMNHSDRDAMRDVESGICCRDPSAKRCGDV